ncbi:S8 family serine peptidase [Sphingomonas sp.]|uniref:S8 family serine peptidase n=1 Tax=Sphingomonas sp. TaxID=28214 RepID=UPI00286E48CF|nr:S8 family serine peptidase [Sphingomonas sp.]
MTRKTFYLLTAATLFAAAPALAQTKKVIASASDLPTVVIALPAKPSELAINGGPGFDRVQDEVEKYAQSVVDGYEVRDVATQKELAALLMQAAMAENRWDDALALSAQIRGLEDKPAAKATAGLLTGSYIRAAKAVGEDSPQFADRFEAEFRAAVQALDWAVVQDSLQAMRAQYQVISRDLLVGSLQGAFDANAAAQGNKVGVGIAAGVVGARRTLTEVLPLKDRIFKVLDARVKSESVEKVDRWSPRLATLAPAQVKQPVTVAVWDSGFDPAVFPGQLWVNAKEQANGRDDDNNGFVDDINGIAFDPDWKPSTGMLRPMPAGDLADIAGKLKLTKGALDLQAAVDSPEAAALRQTMSSLKPDQVTEFGLLMGRMGMYLHGTTTGYTSAVGNPGARVLNARFDARVQQVPEPITEAVGQAMAAYAAQTVDYFKAAGVRVVNMSWRITEPQIEATLATVETDPAKRKARAKVIFETVNGALEKAFRGAPEILFVAGAGNEDEDVDFVRSFPAGINLANVVTVGAVDVALQPAGFTSYGKSIDLYANGFEVPAKVPGGMAINISGTSLAAPQVTNLAAKMLAVNPKLTVAQLRSIIEETATAEGPKGLKVINPAAALVRAAK